MNGNEYIRYILKKYQPRDLTAYSPELIELKKYVINWAGASFLKIINSGSRSKQTAISLSSDVDYLISLHPNCTRQFEGLHGVHKNLYHALNNKYDSVRKQNVSIRLTIKELEIDITPAKKRPGNTNKHSLYVSKIGSWTLTNVTKHANDVILSGIAAEIKLMKIWKELHGLDFPPVYIEYLLIQKILFNKNRGVNKNLSNFLYTLTELAKNNRNPLFARIVDPANSTNILSGLLTYREKKDIQIQAKNCLETGSLEDIIW